MGRPKKTQATTKPKTNSCEEAANLLDKLKESTNLPIGRPGQYKKEFCEMVIAHMSEGLSVSAFAGVCGVSRTTIYNWVGQHADFKAATEIGLSKSLLFWERLGVMLATGAIKGNPTTWAINMHNRFKEDWKQVHNPEEGNKQEVKISVAYERPNKKTKQESNEEDT
jgi:hypothetical protein